MRIHKVPTKQELENFIKEKDLPIDGIYDKDSAIRHFRNTSKKYKAERDTCLKDIEKLRDENRSLKEVNEAQTSYVCKLDEENKELQIQNDLLYQFSKHIGSNPSSSTYKQFRKQLDDIGIRERE